jgi:hypothetical protein
MWVLRLRVPEGVQEIQPQLVVAQERIGLVAHGAGQRTLLQSNSSGHM